MGSILSLFLAFLVTISQSGSQPGQFLSSDAIYAALLPYPRQVSAPVAQPPQDEFAPIWESFYRADLSEGIDWDRLYRETDGSAPDALIPDRNMVFTSYYLFPYLRYEMMSTAEALGGGAPLRALMEEAPLWEKYKVIGRDSSTGEVSEAGQLLLHDSYRIDDGPFQYRLPAKYWTWSKLPRDSDDSKDASFSHGLELTEERKTQLRATDLDLENTQAFAVKIDGYVSGILFSDSAREYFLPLKLEKRGSQYPPDEGIAPGGDLERVPGCTEEYTLTAPVEITALNVGKLIPLRELTADFQRIAYGDWYYTIILKRSPANTGKPVIYLYPEKETDVSVKLRFQGDLTYTYPAYGDGWNVTAHPGGRIVNKADRSEHYYLFWEGVSDGDWTFDQGFCVKGTDTEAFLREKLPLLGLTPREYNDFITYWVPKMQGSPYNLIKFADTEYDKLASLTVTPKPDILARIHMVYKPLEKPVEIPPQTLSGFERKGFTVVEWGGTEAGPKSITK